jgi:protein-disulfide isomerase
MAKSKAMYWLQPFLFSVALFAVFSTLTECYSQPSASTQLTPALKRRIEVFIRSQSNLPPEYDLQIRNRQPSDFAGYDEIVVTFITEGKAIQSLKFLLSKDGKKLAQLNTFDIAEDPKPIVGSFDRPGRSGVNSAPVTVVVFDDLECPFCAQMDAELFPAIMNRYGDKVRVVYEDFPLSIHPWAMRAAVDTNCLAIQSNAGYWNLVDYIHAHTSEINMQSDPLPSSLIKSNNKLDKLTHDEGTRQNVDLAKLDACLEKQDESLVRASMREADSLGVSSTPTIFVGGEKISGVVSIDALGHAIDRAFISEGITPPVVTIRTTKKIGD